MAQPQIRLPTLSSTSCCPFSTAITPGIFNASDVTILLTLACACGLRTKWAKVMPNSLMSSTYLPLPVIKRRSSLRTTLAPIPSTPMFPSLPEILCPPIPSNAAVSKFSDWSERLLGRLRDLHAPCGIQHRLDDVVIAGAAADVAFQLMADRGFVQLATVTVHDVDRQHDHARGAVAALQAVIVA